MTLAKERVIAFGNRVVCFPGKSHDEVGVNMHIAHRIKALDRFENGFGMIGAVDILKNGGICRLHADLKLNFATGHFFKDHKGFFVQKRGGDLKVIFLGKTLVKQGLPDSVCAFLIEIEGTVDEFDDLDVVKGVEG